MKLSRGFIVVLLFLFVILVLVEVKIPKKFTWDEYTFSHYDPNPFGAQLVDSLLQSSVKNGYEVKMSDLYSALNDTTNRNSTLLFVDYALYESDEFEITNLHERLKRGQNIVWISDELLCDTLEDLLDAKIVESYNYHAFGNHFLYDPDSLSLHWEGDNKYDSYKYDFRIFNNEYSTIFADFYSDKCVWTPLLHIKQMNTGDLVVAATRECGKGKLILVTVPQIFTNYNLLEKDGANLLMRIISMAGDAPVLRYDNNYYNNLNGDEHLSESPLRFFLDHKSLRWAIYLTFITILLSLFFTARRKQRVIPIIESPKNQTLTMVKHIGLMYYRHHDNASLLQDMYKHFGKEIMRHLFVDINDEADLNDNINIITNKSGIDVDEFKQAISRLKYIDLDTDIKISDKETKYLIDLMNNVTNSIIMQ